MKAATIAAVICAAYLFITTRATLWDRDEPRFARAAVEMVESGDYLVPTFNGRWRLHKPILIYWLMSLPVRLLGPTELACRFFAAVGTAATSLLTFFIARRLFDVRAALWSMIVLASSVMILYIGTAATADAVLLPCMLGVVAVFVAVRGRKTRWHDVLLMGLALGLAQLAKGPVALLSIVVLVVTLVIARKHEPASGRYALPILLAAILGMLVFLAWAVPANNATDGEFMRFGVGKHVVGRSISPMENHGGEFLLYLPYYLPVILAGFFPWVLHLPGAVSAVLGRRVGGSYFRSLFVAWTATILLFMTLVATKLPHYILFIWPALALAVAGTLDASGKRRLTQRDVVWLRRGVWFFIPIAFAAVVALILIPLLLEVPGLLLPAVLCAIVLALMAAIAVYCHRTKSPTASAKVLVAGMTVFMIPFLLGVLPAVERIKISPALAAIIKDEVSPHADLAACKYIEPSLIFYAGRNIEHLRTAEAVLGWTKQPGPGALIMPRDTLRTLEERLGPLPLKPIGSKRGFNYTKGRMREVLVLARAAVPSNTE